MRKNTVRFAHVLFDFTSLYLFVLTFAMKETNCKSHWNILVFCDQWKILSDLNMSHGKNFVSFPLFGFTLVIKLRNFDFESSWNTLILFDKKIYDVRFEYVRWKNNLIWLCPVKQYLIWFNLLKLGIAFLYPLKTSENL